MYAIRSYVGKYKTGKYIRYIISHITFLIIQTYDDMLLMRKNV